MGEGSLGAPAPKSTAAGWAEAAGGAGWGAGARGSWAKAGAETAPHEQSTKDADQRENEKAMREMRCKRSNPRGDGSQSVPTLCHAMMRPAPFRRAKKAVWLVA